VRVEERIEYRVGEMGGFWYMLRWFRRKVYCMRGRHHGIQWDSEISGTADDGMRDFQAVILSVKDRATAKTVDTCDRVTPAAVVSCCCALHYGG
jgi:hypothetical protein